MKLVRNWIFCLIGLGAGATVSAGDIYKVDPDHTFSSFEYTHWGLSQQRGRFDSNSGQIEFDPAAKSGSIEIQIDAASINTGSELFNKILRSDNFFDVAAYPKIVFKSSAMHFDADRLTQVDGDLSIRGITRPATFEITHFACRFTILYLKQACGANGQTKILRSDFNIGRFTPFVSDEVTLSFSLEAIRETRPADSVRD